MQVFFNECSMHGQFPNVQSFVTSLDALMQMRQTAQRYGRELLCHRNCKHSKVTRQLALHQAIHLIERSKAQALMSWFGRTGPYWEDGRRHAADDLLECSDEVVTDTAIAECAHLNFANKPAQLASISPSAWTASPLKVVWHKSDKEALSTGLLNHVSTFTLEPELVAAASPLQSWEQMAHMCRQNFDNLQFSDNTFKPLKGKPFVFGAAKSIVDLLAVLSQFKGAHLPEVGRSEEGHWLYREYFTNGLWFSDSSDREKVDFRREMSFPHPEKPGERIFAPYHGKVQTPQMRVHFSWPVTADRPVYVVYIGDKITKY